MNKSGHTKKKLKKQIKKYRKKVKQGATMNDESQHG